MEQNVNLPVAFSGMTKTQITINADLIVQNVLKTGNVLEVVEQIAALEAIIKQIKGTDEFKTYALEEVAKHGKEFKSPSGAKIAPMESGISYGYEFCGDPELAELLAEQEQLEIKISDRKAFLKTLPVAGMEILKDDEVIQIYPPFKTSTSTYKVTLAK
jgi:hypothetical protein